MPDINDYIDANAEDSTAIEDMGWWTMLTGSKFPRLVHFFGSKSKTLQEFNNSHGAAVDGRLGKISPNMWNAILYAMNRSEQTGDELLCQIPYRLEAVSIVSTTEGGYPIVTVSASNGGNKALKRLRGGKTKETKGVSKIKATTAPIPRIESRSYAWCVLISVVAFRINLLISHKLAKPSHAWYRIADQAMDLIVPRKYRNMTRTNTGMESLLFNSILGTREKNDFNIIRCAAKAVVICLRGLSTAAPSSRIYQDLETCLHFSSLFQALGQQRSVLKVAAPDPGDLWVSMEGPLQHAEIVSQIRLDRCSLKQYLSTTHGFGSGISAGSEASFHWYHLPNSDKASLINTLQSISFLAFGEELKVADQGRWMILQTSRPGSYLLGLRKDSALVIRYAGFVLRLKLFGSRRRRPPGICKDMPSYMLVFRHLQAVLEKDEKTIPKQHWDTVLRLSLMAIRCWYGKTGRLGKTLIVGSRNTGAASIIVPNLDSYGFRVLMSQGLEVLFKSALHHQGRAILTNLWNSVQKDSPTGLITPESNPIDFLDMLNVSFLLGRQKDSISRRLSDKHDFDIFQQQAETSNKKKVRGFHETERKATLGAIHGKVFLKSKTLLNLHQFLDRNPQGKQLAENPRHQSLVNIIRKGHHTFQELMEMEKDEQASNTAGTHREEKITDNYVCLCLRRQELDVDLDHNLRLPPSDVLLKNFYALIRDPLTPNGIRFSLITALTTNQLVKPFPGSGAVKKFRTCHTESHRNIWLKTFNLHLPLVTEFSDTEIYGNSRVHLMLLLMLIELTGLRNHGHKDKFPATDFLEAIRHLIVADPERLSKLPLSMIPVAVRDKTIVTYGSMFPLPSFRYCDNTWGSPAIGLHAEVLGMDSNPTQVFETLLAEMPLPAFSQQHDRDTSHSLRETKIIAKAFCNRMTTQDPSL